MIGLFVKNTNYYDVMIIHTFYNSNKSMTIEINIIMNIVIK